MGNGVESRWEEDVQVFGVLGNPVAHSLSPIMHRAAFQAMGLRADYVPFKVLDLPPAVSGIRALGIRGVSVTIPFKEEIIPLLDRVDEVAREIGAVNTVLVRNGELLGHNTDWLGLSRALGSRVKIQGKSFAILGAGGAARAAAYAILKEGGTPVILTRDPSKARRIAAQLGGRWESMERLAELEVSGLINTTPVGMAPFSNQSPVPKGMLAGFEVVMDVVYNPLRTRLLREAQQEGAVIVSGIDMFLHQGAEQIRIWTGMEPPWEVMRDAVLSALEKRDAS